MRLAAGLAVAWAACIPPSFAGQLPVPCAAEDRACALAAGKSHPARQMPFWAARFALPVDGRVGIAPPELVQFLALDAIAQGIPARPRMASDNPPVLADVRAALATLPPAVKDKLSARFAGVYLMENFGGTGFTDVIRDPSGHEVAAFVVLDPLVLEQRTANAWATWKESSPFMPDPRYALQATLEDRAHDTRQQAIQYILLHELGHVLSVAGNFHPSWNDAPPLDAKGRYPFFDISWSVEPGKGYVTRFADALPERPRVRYYFGAQLHASEMAATYRHLEATAFPTLYAATIPGDDFAESFANYVHVVLLGKPFGISILEDGKVIERYKSCWDEPRCSAKRRILENFLK